MSCFCSLFKIVSKWKRGCTAGEFFGLFVTWTSLFCPFFLSLSFSLEAWKAVFSPRASMQRGGDMTDEWTCLEGKIVKLLSQCLCHTAERIGPNIHRQRIQGLTTALKVWNQDCPGDFPWLHASARSGAGCEKAREIIWTGLKGISQGLTVWLSSKRWQSRVLNQGHMRPKVGGTQLL